MSTDISITEIFLSGHQLELDGKVGCVHMLLSPDQITHLTDLLAALCIDIGTVQHSHYDTLGINHIDSVTSAGPYVKQLLKQFPP